MDSASDEVRAILGAYVLVSRASWPEINPSLGSRESRWPTATEAQLRDDLARMLQEVRPPKSNIRIFWKLGPKFVFGGCNGLFAKDAGLNRPEDMIGIDDYDKRLPWRAQASKYRRDDQSVAQSGTPNLDLVERQESSDGTIQWVRAGKAPIRTASGEILGILGMYELLDAATGRALFMKAALDEKKPK